MGILSWFHSLFSPPPPPDPVPLLVHDLPPTVRSGESLNSTEVAAIFRNTCPDCGVGPLYAGPEAGMSQNIYCNDADCGSRFNVCMPFGVDRISNASPDKAPPTPTLKSLPYR